MNLVQNIPNNNLNKITDGNNIDKRNKIIPMETGAQSKDPTS